MFYAGKVRQEGSNNRMIFLKKTCKLRVEVFEAEGRRGRLGVFMPARPTCIKQRKHKILVTFSLFSHEKNEYWGDIQAEIQLDDLFEL